MVLLDNRGISFEDYRNLRRRYLHANRNLYLYELAPRIFGQIWGENHLRELDERIQKASKELDTSFQVEYDLIIEGIRVEVKACRAINTKVRGGLISKALCFHSDDPFWMNFQQIKFDICEVFVFIGVWVDEIKYWVLSHDEVGNNRHLSSQHRGGIEYQIGIKDTNIHEFKEYLVAPEELANRIIEKGKSRTQS